MQREKETLALNKLKLLVPQLGPPLHALALQECNWDAERAVVLLRQFQVREFAANDCSTCKSGPVFNLARDGTRASPAITYITYMHSPCPSMQVAKAADVEVLHRERRKYEMGKVIAARKEAIATEKAAAASSSDSGSSSESSSSDDAVSSSEGE